jgi:arginyl-tRNA synthetase
MKAGRIIVEFLSANVAKPLHVGHLRNAILGDALVRILEASGEDVVRWNYLGDWGTQFGKLIVAYRKWGEEEKLTHDPISYLVSLYVKFHQEAAEKPELESEARMEFRKLEEGDAENRALWDRFRQMTIIGVDEFLTRLEIPPFDEDKGEAFYEKDMNALIAELQDKGIVRESEGALIVPLEDKNLPPGMIRKTDGGSLYLTRDIANLRYRLNTFNPEKILYVVGNEQSLAMEQLYAVAEILGLTSAKLQHIKYGLVLGESGKKFSTREGNVVTASDILDEAEKLAAGTVAEKRADLSEEERAEISRHVALGALKYALLKDARTTDIVFDWERMLDFHGDSGPYLQYTHARLCALLKKAETMGLEPELSDEAEMNKNELALIRHLADFSDAIVSAASEYAPNRVCLYLYELSNKTNTWYEGEHILSDENKARRAMRLALAETTALVLRKGLYLLGIPAPERI